MPEPIIVTEREHRKGATVFQDSEEFVFHACAREETALAEAVERLKARAVIVGSAPYSGALYKALAKTGHGRGGSVLARYGVGFENIDLQQASSHDILVCNTPGALDASVAELTLWLLGSCVRHLAQAAAQFRHGEFAPQTGIELAGKTLGIIGLGRIGKMAAKAAHFGFGMKVRGCGTSAPDAMAARCGMELDAAVAALGLESYTADADEIFAECDFISLHLPSSAATRHFVDARRLELMKRSAWLINTARGAVVDEEALYYALSGGKIAGAGLDVFQREPYVPVAEDKDLRHLPNVVLTPHIGSDTHEANRRMGEAALENVRSFLNGEIGKVSVVTPPR